MSALAAEERDFYAGLTERNAGVIAADVQATLARATIVVAGCGSIGGAAVEPLARLGARDLRLADPGEYELNNLNRQNAVYDDLGRNKARVAAERVRAINPHARVQVFADGVSAACVDELLEGADVIVDGVDVTTDAGLRAKYLLHVHACARRLPLLTGWDMAGAQYVRVYDYRRLRQVFDGQIERADLDRLNGWQILRRLVPARFVPLEMVTLARANLTNPDFSFPQLVHAADLFGAMASHVVTQLLAGAPVREHICVDLHQQARPTSARWRVRAELPLQVAGTLAALRRSARRSTPNNA